jgi:hypothetical protein
LGWGQRLHMRVAKPEPGHRLRETNLESSEVTEFDVIPCNGSADALVQISAEWQADRGLRGLVGRSIRPALTQWIFTLQLRKLRDYLGGRTATRR